jgi:hypothetical protein
MARLVRGALSIVAGAAIEYFLDPERGRTRRVKAKDRLGAVTRRGSRRLDVAREHATNRLRGIQHGLTHPHGVAPDNDLTLVDKVRSEVLGGQKWHAHTINVDAADGVVTLRGQLDSAQDIHDLREEVARIPGVREVHSYLHLPGTPPPNKQEALRARAT